MKRFDLYYSLVMTLIGGLRDELGEQYDLKLDHYTLLDSEEQVIKCTIFYETRWKGELILKFNIEEEYTNKDVGIKIRKFINLIKEFIDNDFKWKEEKLTEDALNES